MRDRCGAILVEFAMNLMRYSETFIREDQEVMPCVITISENNDLRIYGMLGASSAEQRGAFKQHVARKDRAVAVLLFADTWKRDEGMTKIGEMLMGVVETRSGECSAVVCKYTRDPLTFQPPEETNTAIPAISAFVEKVH